MTSPLCPDHSTALAHRGQTGADVAVVAVGIEEAAHANGADCRPADDALLDAVAELIAENPGPGEAVTVTGSGELMILCGQLGGSGEADPVVRRARDITARPVQVGGVPVPVVAVSGVAMASCPQETAEALVAMAGRAMRAQRATPSGKAAVPYDPALDVPGFGDVWP